ncbi:hypothetical protein FSP39_012910 [Pinctada imbricata]|uniref:Tyrosyl-DNA phosphodiesterase 2 n=1 Tax=Pinctada imbricata TaxID=66713 RepID=A0AA88XVB3_PINIB|nr:hypothetical protein FSP39_012910 [Pinctada imbricata]
MYVFNRGKSEEESEEDKRFRLLSWNIDGLDMPTAVKRAHTVCEIINKENPHVVYLQEVVESTQEVLEARCPTYQIIPGGDREYFTAIMIKVGSVMYREMNVTEYPGTRMMRNLLCVKCKYRGSPLTLMTSHLESTAEYGTERKAQLKMAFDKMVNEPEDRTVIFGGDLNLRDKELAAVGGIPSGIVDLWEETGSRPEAKYTWDMTRNDNLTFNGKYKPRCRFDRLYMKSAKPMKLKPVILNLLDWKSRDSTGDFLVITGGFSLTMMFKTSFITCLV